LVPRAAVVTTYQRPVELARLVASLADQVDHLVVVDNDSRPPAEVDWHGGGTLTVTTYAERPPNLYRMWNVGLETIDALARDNGWEAWDVGLFNDDADVPPGWFDRVSLELRRAGVAACSTDPCGAISMPLLKREPDRDLRTRLCPWAFVVRGEVGMRADEEFGWWWGDTDVDWWCRTHGGVLVLPGDVVPNTLANSTTVGELAEQAGRDAEYFTRKWGFRPW